MPVNTGLVTGDHNILHGPRRNATNAVFVTSFAPKVASLRIMKVILRPIITTARVVVFVLKNVPQRP